MWVSGELNALAVLPQEWKPCPLDRKLSAVSVPNDNGGSVIMSCLVAAAHVHLIFFGFIMTKICHCQGKFLIQLTATNEVIWS